MGLAPDCYSRNIDINNTIIFQPATCLIHMAAIIMTAIMLWHVHSKYTAVGRKELLFFLYIYALSEFLVMFLDSAVIPSYTNAYLWFTVIYVGLKCAIFWCLMLNGFVGFQFAEDGSALSLWSMRISSCVVFIISLIVAGETYKKNVGEGGLWFFEFAFPIIMVVIYVVSQVILVLRTLDEVWPINDIIMGCLAFGSGLILMYGFNNPICENVNHYIDGTFFGALCSLFSVMMVYKYWDSITKEDLEFSVGARHTNWDAKETLIQTDFEGSVQSHDMIPRGMSKTFEPSRTPSPPDHRDTAPSGLPFGRGMTRNTSGGSSFFVAD